MVSSSEKAAKDARQRAREASTLHWRKNFSPKGVSVRKVFLEIKRLEDHLGHSPTSEDIVSIALNKNCVFHNLVILPRNRAVEEDRKSRARRMMGAIQYPDNQRAFNNVRDGALGQNVYKSSKKVRKNKKDNAYMVMRGIARLKAWRQTYRVYPEFKEMSDLIANLYLKDE